MATSFYCLFTACFFVPCSLLIPFAADALSFQIPRFGSEVTNIFSRGDAVPVSSIGAIQFNNNSGVGQVVYATPFDAWDSRTGKVTDFTTHFTFKVDSSGAPGLNHGYGLAFFLAPLDFPIPIGSDAGFLGLFNRSNNGSPKNRILAVEFDSYPYDEWDPNYEHVGININSIQSRKTAPWNATLHRSDIADAWIVYNSTTKNLSVYWSYGSNPNSSLSYQADLKEILPPRVIAGFSAAKGNKTENHQLYSWEFTSDLVISSGKKTWSSRLLVRLLMAGGAALVVVLGGILVAIIVLRKRSDIKWEMAADDLTSTINDHDDLESEAGLKRFSYKDLVSATNSFSPERKLGAGGSGEVYKGNLVDMNLPVAVKKFSRGSKQGKKQYLNELKIISSLRHRNLVRLIGWCHDNGEFLLVYEYMPNGSLDCHLFGKKSPLCWAVRYKIATGLASALLYLHEGWEQRVVHRDIKSSNIMLDSGFNVKLGDFGLAKLVDHELGPQTTGLAGTFGYLAPEYISTGRASKESDVYSFGIVALEIATGGKSVDPILTKDDGSETGLLENVWDLYGMGKLGSIVDERLNINDEFDLKQVECLLTVGLWCAHPDPCLRPSMKQAIQVLNFESSLPGLPTKMPVPMYVSPSSFSSSPEPLLFHSSAYIGR